ncbi:MAG TPA: hypothetical protein P5265_00660 [Bacteroidia bacterium]|nr:hypothetical protein [Sphingobacteriales bacterium]HPD64388.1 hypothetical protein [Bacteroidia bacterium]HRU66984.1 hypothetical protein [Bacteroidia bacterium]
MIRQFLRAGFITFTTIKLLLIPANYISDEKAKIENITDFAYFQAEAMQQILVSNLELSDKAFLNLRRRDF